LGSTDITLRLVQDSRLPNVSPQANGVEVCGEEKKNMTKNEKL
jgi:hypothetical protein